MPRYVVTVPSSKSPEDALAYMADMRLFPEWDRGIKAVTQVKGDGPGLGATFDVTVRGVGGRDTVLRYETTEFEAGRTVLLVGKGGPFTSVDRVNVVATQTGCDVTYDAVLTFSGILSPLSIVLTPIFNKVGDSAAKGMRKRLA